MEVGMRCRAKYLASSLYPGVGWYFGVVDAINEGWQITCGALAGTFVKRSFRVTDTRAIVGHAGMGHILQSKDFR